MKSNYRITFYDGPEGNISKNVDVYAESFDDARKQARQMPEARNRMYSDMMIEQFPEGPSVIGVEFEWTDPYISGVCTGYLFIKANDEAEAVKYYNEHFRGKCFEGSHYGKNVDGAHSVRGRIRKTYFASGCVRFDGDATLEGKEVSLNDKINQAKSQSAFFDRELDNTKHNHVER